MIKNPIIVDFKDFNSLYNLNVGAKKNDYNPLKSFKTRYFFSSGILQDECKVKLTPFILCIYSDTYLCIACLKTRKKKKGYQKTMRFHFHLYFLLTVFESRWETCITFYVLFPRSIQIILIVEILKKICSYQTVSRVSESIRQIF